MVLEPLRAVVSFLTIIPSYHKSLSTRMLDLDYIANNMYLFPLVGAGIGIAIGLLAYGISFHLQAQLVGLIISTGIIIITGASHSDALADFADGLATKGQTEAKKKAMHDPAVGSAGAIALILYILGMVIALSSLYQSIRLFTSLVVAEVIAKYVMVLQAYYGKSAWDGFSTPFTTAMKNKRKFLLATSMTLALIFLFGGYWGLAALGLCIAISAIIRYQSNKSFGGISGDVFGASNELARLSSLILLSSVVPL
ncbi:MAG TPA: adenosylcobinamide-GDP ribazoletransferase [Nitrososphaeraceae archaeon]